MMDSSDDMGTPRTRAQERAGTSKWGHAAIKQPLRSSWIQQSNYPGAEVDLGGRGVRRVGKARGNVQRVGRIRTALG